MKRTKSLWVREPYLSQILSGCKTIEVRVGYDNIRRLQPSNRLKLNDQHLVTIHRIGRYADFEELLAHEDPVAIAPDLPAGKLLDAIREIYPPEKEALGAIALEVTLRTYDAVLFDMGHTLVYFEPSEYLIVQRALQSIGAERSVEEINAAVQTVWGEYYRDAATMTFPATPEYDHSSQLRLSQGLLGQLGLEPGEELVQAYTDLLDSLFSQPGAMQTFPEVVDVLETLRKRAYRLGIISNWSWNLRTRVAQVGLQDYFELVWASSYAGCNKPHPGIFHQALAQMELSPGRALYVGDSYRHDIVGARNAGLDAVLLDRKGVAEESDCPVIQDLWGVLDLLES
jgi:putative hydrolase of the HAD superfamily